MLYYPNGGTDIGSVGWNREVSKIIAYCDGLGLDIGAGGRTINKDCRTLDVNSEEKADIVASGDAIPEPDNKYDYVVSIHSLEHFEDQDKALKEWLRVVKIGGYINIIHPDVEFTQKQKPIAENPTLAKNKYYKHYHERTLADFLAWINTKKKMGFKIIGFGEAFSGWSFYFILQKTK
jgi:ubiquinone/menaquinone biosynthesis C-methylase UbiE